MTKQVLIPLVSLALDAVDDFLELRIEPRIPKHQDCFQGLQPGILKIAVHQARQALNTLPAVDLAGSIYLASSQVALSSSKSTVFALALCPLLMQPEFPFERSMVFGELLFPKQTDQSIQIVTDMYCWEKLQAVLCLAYQTEPLLLIMPPLPPEFYVHDFCQTLAAKNIAVRVVATLEGAYKAFSLALPPLQ